MKNSRKLISLLAAALLLFTPSCVLAIGNDGSSWVASEHPHEDCAQCAELGLHDQWDFRGMDGIEEIDED